jgi:hypothetical protein
VEVPQQREYIYCVFICIGVADEQSYCNYLQLTRLGHLILCTCDAKRIPVVPLVLLQDCFGIVHVLRIIGIANLDYSTTRLLQNNICMNIRMTQDERSDLVDGVQRRQGLPSRVPRGTRR